LALPLSKLYLLTVLGLLFITETELNNENFFNLFSTGRFFLTCVCFVRDSPYCQKKNIRQEIMVGYIKNWMLSQAFPYKLVFYVANNEDFRIYMIRLASFLILPNKYVHESEVSLE